MIPKHRQREFKLQLAARVKLEHTASGETLLRCLLDADARARRIGDSVWNYFASEGAFYKFLHDNQAEIREISDEIVDSERESTKTLFDGLIGSGAGHEDGPAIRQRRMIGDGALKAADDEEFIGRTLEAFLAEIGVRVTEVVRRTLRKYAAAISVIRE